MKAFKTCFAEGIASFAYNPTVLFSPDGIAHLVDGGSLNFHSAATTSTKRIPKGGNAEHFLQQF
jgi:hypothetical protein